MRFVLGSVISFHYLKRTDSGREYRMGEVIKQIGNELTIKEDGKIKNFSISFIAPASVKVFSTPKPVYTVGEWVWNVRDGELECVTGVYGTSYLVLNLSGS